ncbi:hypothetical protein Q7P37_006906 [Cladosporium fusiforme]
MMAPLSHMSGVLSRLALHLSCIAATVRSVTAESQHQNASAHDGGSNSLLSTPTWTVAASGAGPSYAVACNRELASYDTVLSYGITPTGSETFPSTWATTTSFVAPTTKLCDGRVRVLGSLTAAHVGSVLTYNFPTITYTGPGPSCSVQPSDCAYLQSSYLDASNSFSSSLSKYPDAPPGDSPEVPRCYISDLSEKACGQCTIHGGSVQLLYFPETKDTSRDMCATAPTSSVICPFGPTYAHNDTVSGFATAPCQYVNTGHPTTTDSGPSTVVNGTTLYSNRAYISYDTLYATNSCGRVGGTYSNGLVTVASSDVYSVSGYHFQMTHAAYPFRFADLIPPIPASAYLCQANCDDSGSPLGDGDFLNGVPGGGLGFCATIIDEKFRPRLAVPPQIRALDPDFEECLLGLDGLYDPPRLMVSETKLDVPGQTTKTSADAQPQGSPTQTTASPTAASDVIDTPSGQNQHASTAMQESQPFGTKTSPPNPGGNPDSTPESTQASDSSAESDNPSAAGSSGASENIVYSRLHSLIVFCLGLAFVV